MLFLRHIPRHKLLSLKKNRFVGNTADQTYFQVILNDHVPPTKTAKSFYAVNVFA